MFGAFERIIKRKEKHKERLTTVGVNRVDFLDPFHQEIDELKIPGVSGAGLTGLDMEMWSKIKNNEPITEDFFIKYSKDVRNDEISHKVSEDTRLYFLRYLMEEKHLKELVSFYRLRSKMEQMLHLPEEEVDLIQHSVQDFSNILLKDYPNARDYLIFHVLALDTIHLDEKTIYQDFPDKNSVEKFVDNLMKTHHK